MADTVQLNSGVIRGAIEKHEDGFNYYSFKGIPYGEKPIGDLRFKDPVPKKNWSDVLDCKNYGPIGFQHDLFTGEECYDEDFLHLNVFSHSINNTNENRPVMFYIHGGDYNFGAANDNYCTPTYLIRKKIVLVTVNFRLGVMGFLDTEDEVAPGNQGLKDIALALQWVQQNIRVFGGNPENVTVFGSSSGGITSNFIALSPMCKGLIHKVISQSACSYTPWAAQDDPKGHAIKLCSLLGKNLSDSKDIVDFLRSVDTKSLLKAQHDLRKYTKTIPFGPGCDHKSSNPFMPTPINELTNPCIHLPYLIGGNSHTGLISLLGISREEFFKMCDKDFEQMILYNMKEVLARNNLNAQQLRRFYYKSDKVSTDNLDKYVELATDMYFTESLDRLTRIQAENSSAPTYIYRFSYDTPDSLGKMFLKNAPTGASLLDEIPYLFRMAATPITFKKDTRSYKMMEQLTEMWTNFATHGRPTIETSDLIPVHWKPVADGTLLRYLNIDEDITMQYRLNVDQKLASAASIKV